MATPGIAGRNRPVGIVIQIAQNVVGVEQEAFVAVAHEEDRGEFDAGLLELLEIEDELDEDLGALGGFFETFIELVFQEQAQEHIHVQIAIALAGIVEGCTLGEEDEEATLIGRSHRMFVCRVRKGGEEALALRLCHLCGHKNVPSLCAHPRP